MHRGAVYFWIWVASLVLLSVIAVYFAFYKDANLGIFVATAVAAISYPFVVLADRYVWTPQLKILYEPENDPDLYRPTLVFFDPTTKQLTPPRTMLRVAVFNKGSKTAESCVGEIEGIGRVTGCEAFSKEPKVLKWTRAIDQPISILPSRKPCWR